MDLNNKNKTKKKYVHTEKLQRAFEPNVPGCCWSDGLRARRQTSTSAETEKSSRKKKGDAAVMMGFILTLSSWSSSSWTTSLCFGFIHDGKRIRLGENEEEKWIHVNSLSTELYFQFINVLLKDPTFNQHSHKNWSNLLIPSLNFVSGLSGFCCGKHLIAPIMYIILVNEFKTYLWMKRKPRVCPKRQICWKLVKI